MAIVNLLISISFIFILLWPCFTVMQHTAPCTIAINFYLTGREVSFGNVLSKGIGRPNFRGSQTYFESSKINIKLWNFNWQNWIVKLICFITCSLSKMKHNDQSQIWSFLPNLCLYMLNYVLLQHNQKLYILTYSTNHFNKFTKGDCTSAFETTFLILTTFFEISSSPITTATGMPLSSQYWTWVRNFGLTRYDCSVYNTKTSQVAFNKNKWQSHKFYKQVKWI